MSVAMVGAGVAAVGAISQASSASKASKAQAQSSREALELEKETRDLTRADNAPFLARGNQAANRLQYLMGLGGAEGGAGGGGAGAYTAQPLDRAALREQLLPQFSSTVKPQMYYGENEGAGNGIYGYQVPGGSGGITNVAPVNPTTIDEAGLNAEIERRYAASQANAGTYGGGSAGGDPNDPAYGSLMRRFTMADRDADPVYQSGLQFGLDEGTKAINNRAGAGGAFLSGATLKALTRFGNDYGSTKAAGAYDRFTNDQGAQYNRLAGIAGTGQTAAGQLASANNAYASRAGDYITQGGNAAAAGYVGQANALTGGISQGYGMYQNNQLMDMIRNPNRGGGWGSTGGWSGGGRVVPDYPGAEY